MPRRRALCAILDDFEVPWGPQNEAKNLSHPSPTPPRKRRCVVIMRLWVPKVDFGSFSEGSGVLNVEKYIKTAGILRDVRVVFETKMLPGVALVEFVQGFHSSRF